MVGILAAMCSRTDAGTGRIAISVLVLVLLTAVVIAFVSLANNGNGAFGFASMPLSSAESECGATEGLTALDVSGTASGESNDFTDDTWTELTEDYLNSIGTAFGCEIAANKYYLAGDITISNYILIASGVEVTIDLNGYMLKGNGTNKYIYKCLLCAHNRGQQYC